MSNMMSDKDIEDREFKEKELEASEPTDEMIEAKIRIPTQQYAYVEIDFFGTVEELKEKHDEVNNLFNQKAGDGLDAKEWRETLDGYLRGEGTNSETFSRMSEKQQYMIQELKKSFKRTVNNLEK